MNTQKTVFIAITCVVLFFTTLLSPASANGQLLENLQWGSTVDGLQMSVSISDSRKADVLELQFMIRNVGEKDAILNLGTMLANGKVQLPDRIGLNLTDANGKTRKFVFLDPEHAFIAGRRDDYIVPLRSGSAYELIIGLDKFYSSDNNEFGSKLPSGKYQFMAQFEGDGAKISQLATKSWSGELRSNLLAIEK